MLSASEAFRVGFLSRCVEEQLTPEETLACVKRASELLEKRGFIGGVLSTLVGKTMDIGKTIGGNALGYGIPLALAAPPILGGAAGYGLAKATDINDTDIDDIKDREVIDEYRRQTDRLNRHLATRQAKKDRQPQRARLYA